MVTIRRTLLALAVGPWTGVAFVHLWDPTAFRFHLRSFFSVSVMLAAYGYLAETVFALPILLIWEKSRNPRALVAVLWASLGATGTVLLVLVFASRGNVVPLSEVWLAVSPKVMWPYWVAASLSGLTYLLLVRRSRF